MLNPSPADSARDIDAFLGELHEFGRSNTRWNVPPDHGRFLWTMAEATDAKRVLEIGTSNGYSTIWLARAMKVTGGKIVTLEIDEGRHAEAVANFKKVGVEGVIDARLGDALKLIPELKGKFDLIFIDAKKEDYIKYFEMTYPMLEPGGVILGHNAVALADSMRAFLDKVEKHPELVTTVVQMGRDGFSVSYRKRSPK